MSLGSFHIEVGLLLKQRGAIILQRDEGGRWRLKLDKNVKDLLGRRVRVEGLRLDDHVLDVTRITAI